MSHFKIDFDWISKFHGPEVGKATFAEITITIDDVTITEVYDKNAKTVRSGIYVSAYTLAKWLAYNYWRLRWEPKRYSSDWKMSHRIGAAGDGYLWPNISIYSDGGSIIFESENNSDSTQAVRYLHQFTKYIATDTFESEIDEFITNVLRRIDSMGIKEDELYMTWKDLIEEKNNYDLKEWRKLEAIMGYDPDEAPSESIVKLLQKSDEFGKDAIFELAAEYNVRIYDELDNLEIDKLHNKPIIYLNDYRNMADLINNDTSRYKIPWLKGEKAAQLLRGYWKIGNDPIDNTQIVKLLNIEENILDEPHPNDRDKFNIGLRNGHPGGFTTFLKSPFAENRRFALMRILADHLVAPDDDRLLPAVTASTERQKFQRAFAREILCPIEQLKSDLDLNSNNSFPDDDMIDTVARKYAVSPRLIETVLVNKGFRPGN